MDSQNTEKLSFPMFTYSPLYSTPSGPQIRIVELRSGTVPDPIQCTLHHETLSPSMAPYFALSYCWGSTNSSPTSPGWRGIIVAHRTVLVTQNLHWALARLRSPTKSIRLWVDALCINQADTAEKSGQVRLMGAVYSLAREVIVWLGEQAEHSPLLEHFVPLLQAARLKQIRNNDSRTLFELAAAGDLAAYNLPHPIGGTSAWYALCRVTTRPWFRRTWIIQEISLARVAVVRCGGWALPWDMFVDAVLFVQDFAQDMFHGLYDSGAVQMLALSRSGVARGARQDLASLLLRHRESLASERRDKIYALCGLARDGGQIEIDYGKGGRVWEDVYREAAVRMLEGGRLDVLSAAHVHDGEEGEQKGEGVSCRVG